MPKESVIKTLKKDKTVDIIPVPVVSINPTLSVYELLKKIHREEEKKHVSLLSLTFEGSIQADNPMVKFYGKKRRLKIKFTNDTNIPRTTIKFDEKYTTIDLIDAFDELEKDLLEMKHDYSMDIYPSRLFILDKGSISNKSLIAIKFNKERKISKQSEFGRLLKGLQVEPLDAVMIYVVTIDKRTGKYKFGKGSIPGNIAKEKEQYEMGKFVLNIDHVERYTRHVCHASFTGVRTCQIGRSVQTIAKFSAIDGIASCEWEPNPENNENKNNE
ncbi:hypothetical protein LCGC14_0546750 [marine sediment metagenome]|uniref:Uncharacterized protein n=1 Tax=marine sediment metagenome TaxID=412755 RepID=A0A0F9RR91_9ZZZZ